VELELFYSKLMMMESRWLSRGLNKAERNYAAHKLEFLALKWAVTSKFHDYLFGSTFTVFTGNNPLTYVLTSAKLDATGHRWVSELSAYNFTIKYRPGKNNADADGLSRLPQENSGCDTLNEMSHDTIRALCQCHTTASCIETVCMSTDVLDDIDSVSNSFDSRDWRKHQMEDKIIGKFLRCVTNKQRPTSGVDCRESKLLLKEFGRLNVRRGVLYRCTRVDDQDQYQLVLPKGFRHLALKGAHNDIGHLRRERGIHLLRERFYWPKMNSDLDDWVKPLIAELPW
jgi:hypothetical protein